MLELPPVGVCIELVDILAESSSLESPLGLLVDGIITNASQGKGIPRFIEQNHDVFPKNAGSIIPLDGDGTSSKFFTAIYTAELHAVIEDKRRLTAATAAAPTPSLVSPTKARARCRSQGSQTSRGRWLTIQKAGERKSFLRVVLVR